MEYILSKTPMIIDPITNERSFIVIIKIKTNSTTFSYEDMTDDDVDRLCLQVRNNIRIDELKNIIEQ